MASVRTIFSHNTSRSIPVGTLINSFHHKVQFINHICSCLLSKLICTAKEAQPYSEITCSYRLAANRLPLKKSKHFSLSRTNQTTVKFTDYPLLATALVKTHRNLSYFQQKTAHRILHVYCIILQSHSYHT